MSDYRTASPDRYVLLKAFAHENRKNATLAEQVLWKHLERKQLGVKFLRQHIIGDYIVDFVSREQGLVIEVDGGYHAERQQQERDELREQDLDKMGFHVMRFTNEEVMFDIDSVINQIENYLTL
jgi:very-short-patch-repair endonuclease